MPAHFKSVKATFTDATACRRGAQWGLLGALLLGQAWAAAPVSPAVTPAAGLFQWQPFLAPFHSVVLHFPIGFVTLAFLLELYYWVRPSREVARVVSLVLGLSVGAAALAAALGLMRAGSADYDTHTLTVHQWTGLTVVGLVTLSFGLHALAQRGARRIAPTLAYRCTLSLGVGLMTVAGHFGGNLTHGSKYLVKNAPAFVKSFMDDESTAPAKANALGDPQDQFYAEKIQPVFAAKCLECHGPEKQKGGFRLDVKAFALKGGKSGERAIIPGDPLHSHLVQVITALPTDDAIMPPEGKAILSPQEILDIIHWIANGAHFLEPLNTPIPPAYPSTNGPGTVREGAQLPATMTTTAPVVAATEAPRIAEPANRARSELPGTLTFAHDIQPIFAAHCVFCHGPEKQKRGLRLDSREAVLRGDRDGEAVLIPGHAPESLLYVRVALPEQFDPLEEHMPPLHKKVPMSTREIATVADWINAGAP